MNQLLLISPEIFIVLVALLILLGEAFFPKANRLWLYASIGSLILVGCYFLLFFIQQQMPGLKSFGIEPFTVQGKWIQYNPLFNMLAIDFLGAFFKLALLSSVVVVLWLSLDYFEFIEMPMGIYSFLLLLATVGMMFLVSSTDLLMAVISLEIVSITSFILTGFVFQRRSAGEAAMKFFLVGSLSTAILLFGISYYYGYFGTTSLVPLMTFQLNGQPDMALSLILIMLVSGLGFKLAMVPFHMWAPDAYEGAPTPITAFLSVAPKAAAIGFLLRLLSNHQSLHFTPVLAGLAALTMTVGNIGAIHQTNIKRLMAYSSIAQVGYILVAFVAGGSTGSQAALIYTFIYLFMNLGVFTVLIIVANSTRSEEINIFAGLSKKSFGLAMILVLFLLSMVGIPPMAGFIGKFTIFSAVIQKPELLWLGIVAVVNSVVSLYYYFKIVNQMFFKESEGLSNPLRFSPALVSCLVVALGVTLLAGILPNHLLNWVKNIIGS